MYRGKKHDHNAVWQIFILELRCLALQLVTSHTFFFLSYVINWEF